MYLKIKGQECNSAPVRGKVLVEARVVNGKDE
jgi:hypothetical protein